MALEAQESNNLMEVIKPYYIIESEINGVQILKHLEKATRTCYKSEDKIKDGSDERLLRSVLKRGHESVIEHCSFTVRFICDRGISHELVRHRLASFSQESTRYCNYSGGVQFIEPCAFWDLDKDAEKWATWYNTMTRAEKAYLYLLELGASPQEARSVLPNSLKTEIVVTANLREWRHIFNLRCSQAAHPQMRELMIPLLKDISEQIPVIFDDLVEKYLKES